MTMNIFIQWIWWLRYGHWFRVELCDAPTERPFAEPNLRPAEVLRVLEKHRCACHLSHASSMYHSTELKEILIYWYREETSLWNGQKNRALIFPFGPNLDRLYAVSPPYFPNSVQMQTKYTSLQTCFLKLKIQVLCPQVHTDTKRIAALLSQPSLED
jgi:hypothetical protein